MVKPVVGGLNAWRQGVFCTESWPTRVVKPLAEGLNTRFQGVFCTVWSNRWWGGKGVLCTEPFRIHLAAKPCGQTVGGGGGKGG